MTAAPDDRLGAYLVFSQDGRTTPDVAAWSRQAERFFGGARLTPGADGRSVILERRGVRAERRLAARTRDERDATLADQAEARRGGGLGRLSARCPVVWEIAREGDVDQVALEIAAIVASVVLGPILDARVPELLGVKSARERLGI